MLLSPEMELLTYRGTQKMHSGADTWQETQG